MLKDGEYRDARNRQGQRNLNLADVTLYLAYTFAIGHLVTGIITKLF